MASVYEAVAASRDPPPRVQCAAGVQWGAW